MFRIALFILSALALVLTILTGSITAAGMAAISFMWAIKLGA